MGIKGGDKLRAALARIASTPTIQVQAGVLAGATNEETGEKIAPYAAANEFGTRNIPPRPFMRSTIANKSGEWGQILGAQLRGRLQEAGGVEAAFDVVGQVMASDIKDSIEQSLPPPNAPETVARKAKKGNASPGQTLVDTGSLQRAIDYEVIKSSK
ncbi:hypothetical protein [Xenorhabdus innexi]|uniref:Bacteriophage protein n=1 Tax=Xenorhabdus innexi TaxID=290109 RepID=A0A1N6MZC7_9GAMM|nr:hypothetical protein [Xenorhabdus innexi]PHM30021.1 hypothetical protein Xinn_03604 [Xenorhabdus innexi]SIP74172.1 conserved hypothetical protein [Xenorhabdus innexi]